MQRINLAAGLVGIVLGLGASTAGALVRFDNFRGSQNVPTPVVQPSYVNYDGQKHDVQMQNLIDFAAGPSSNIASSGTDTNINWIRNSNTLCSNGSGSQACADRLQGRVTYALVKFPTAGTYYFGAAHDDEVKIEFSTTFASMDPANYRNYDYNVPVGGVGPWTSGDNGYDTIPGNFVVSQPGACYAMRIYWNNQGGVNLLRLGWRMSTPPASPTAADYPFIPDANLRDPADPNSYADCAVVDTDLVINKAGPATFQAGTRFDPGYTITLWNKGPNPISNATFADTLPASLTVGSGGFVCKAYDGNGGQMGAGTANIQVTNNGKAYAVTMGGLLAVNASDQPPTSGARLVCTVDVTASANPGNSVTNTATITVNDRDPTNNTSSVTSVRSDIVSITKSGPATALVGESFTYKLTLNNNSNAAKAGVIVQDQLPPGVTATQAKAPGGAVSCTNLNSAGALLSCTIANSIPSKGSQDILLTVVASNKQAITNYTATNPGGSGNPPSAPGPLCNAATTSCDKASTTVLGDPLLTLAKTADVARAPQGGAVNFTLKISNTGQLPSSQPTTVVDTIPAGLTVNSVANGPGFTCTPSGALPLAGDGVGTKVVCTSTAGIAVGTADAIVATLATTKTVGQDVTNPASITAGDGDCPSAGRCNASATVGGTPQLQISKATMPTNAFTVGQPGSYTITVTNMGNAATTADATVTDTIDASLEILEAPGCQVNAQQVSCPIPAGLATNTPITFTVKVLPKPVPQGTSVSNSASVQGGGDPSCMQPGDCSSTVEIPVDAPKLVIGKSVQPSGAFVAGVPARYVLKVTNVGNAATTAEATVTDTVDSWLVIGQLPPECSASGQVVSCTVPAGLGINMPKSFVIPVTPKPEAGGQSVTNRASVHGGGDPTCDQPNDCNSNDVKVSVNAPHLVTEKEASAPSFTVGVPGYYTIRVTNTGTASTTAVATIRDTVASSLQIDLAKLAEQGCSAQGQVVTCPIAAGLQTNMPQEFQIWVTPLPVAANTAVTNTAYVVGGGDPSCQPNQPCKSDPVEVPITAPSLTIEKKASAEVFELNVPASYTITVTNEGTAATTAPAAVTDVIASALTIGTPLPAGCVLGQGAQSNMVTCTVAAGLAVDASQVFTIPVTPTDPQAVGQSVVNKANVVGGGDPSCTTATSCESEEVETPINAPSLVVEKEALTSFVVGKTAQYQITVTNKGTAPTTEAAAVSDKVASSLEIDMASLPAGCTVVEASNTVNCSVASPLQPNDSKVFTITVTPKPSALGQPVMNKAEVTGGGDPSCVSACESNEVIVTVNSPKLVITKSASTDPFIVGQQASYSITVRNTGDTATTAVATVNDTVPDGLTIQGAQNCTVAGQLVACTVAAGLQPDASVIFTIQVLPTAAAQTPVMNVASVTGGGDPKCEESCQSNQVIVPVARPHVTVAKEATGVQPVGGQKYTATYQVRVRNQGTAAGVYTLTDTPSYPEGVVLDSWTVQTGDGTVNPGLEPKPGNNQRSQISGADVAIAAGATHTYTVAMTFTSNKSVSDLECSADTQGHGAFNQAGISGSTTDSSNSCSKLPPIVDGNAAKVPVGSNTMLVLLGLLLAMAAAWQVRGKARKG
ncbi:MAG: hypothetical protein ACN6O3_05075 [Comamonas sp.]